MIDVLTIEGAMDETLRSRLLAELRIATSVDAPVYGASPAGSVQRGVRSTKSVEVAPELHAAIREIVLGRKRALEAHFGVPLTELEPLQFLRYREGDFFVAHQDGNTPLIHDDTRFRRVSVVLFVSEPDSYAGGALLFHGRYPDFDQRQDVNALPGTLVAFRSETTHEVTPVTHGERFTVVSWWRG